MERKMRRSSSSRSSSSSSFFFFSSFLLLLLCESVSSTSVALLIPAAPISGSPGPAAFRRWAGCSVGEGGGRCAAVGMDHDSEFQLDSEINRRLLASGGGSIGKGALDPNKPVCKSSDGTPYRCTSPPVNPPGGRTCEKNYYRCDHK